VTAASILLLETDPAAGDLLRTDLGRSGYKVTIVLDTDRALRAAPDHHLVIVDNVGPGKNAPDVCRELHLAPSLANMPVLCISQTEDVEERIRFLEAGADDVIARPFDARELEARVEALLLRFQRSRDLTPVPTTATDDHRRCRIVAVFGPKGGTGTTSIAVNTGVLANQLHPQRALVVDLDLQFGAVATHLNLPLNNSLADLVRDEEAMRDPDMMRSYISVHDSGLQVIGAAESPEYASLVTAKHVERLLATVASVYEAVVIDAGSTLDDRSLAVMELAEAIVVPTIADLAALRALRTMVDYLNDTGSAVTKSVFVLNHIYPKEPLRTSDVESAIGSKFALELPYDPMLYVKAVNEGVPLIIGSPKSAAADRMSRLAGLALAGDSATPTTTERRRGLGGLLRRPA